MRIFAAELFAALLGASGIASPAFAHQGENHAAVPQQVEADGVVTAVDARANRVTLRHGPIPALRWPAMTMTFPVESAALLEGVRVGARVHFTLVNHEGRPMVSAIHVQ